MAISKDDVIRYIESLGEAEAVELCHIALKNRRRKVERASGDFQIDDAYCIATCTFGRYEGKIDEEVIVELYAKPPVSLVSSAPGSSEVLSEQGECSLCGVSLISYIKRAVCPVCDTENYLT